MRKKIIVLILCLAFCLTGCNEARAAIEVNPRCKSPKLVQIVDKGCLYYDSYTNIVYIWNGYCKYLNDQTSANSYDATPSPYYDEFGGIYKYDIENNKLVPSVIWKAEYDID